MSLLKRLSHDNEFNVLEYGAKGDGTTKDTDAIRKAAQACANAGSGVLHFPAPGKYLTAPFNLSSGMTLMIDEGATILGSLDRDDYPFIAPLPSYGTGRENKAGFTARYHPLVYAVNVTDLTITGGGVIDGQGHEWYDWHTQGILNCTRPGLLEVQYGENIVIDNITLTNSPFWTVHPIYCNNVRVTNCQILNPTVANTDGIDPDSSSNVYIANNIIQCGDDNIAIKSGWDEAGVAYGVPSQNILIENNTFGPGNGMAIGSETGGGVRNVTIRNNKLKLTGRGVFIKSGRERGGVIDDIVIDGMTLDAVALGIDITMYYTHMDPVNKTLTPVFNKISISNLSGYAAQAGQIQCLPESPCNQISLDNVKIYSAKGFDKCEYAAGTANNVFPNIDKCLPAP